MTSRFDSCGICEKPRAVRKDKTTMTAVSLASLVFQLLRVMRLEPAGNGSRLNLVISCSGSGASSMVLGSILGEDIVKEVYAAKCEPSAVFRLSAKSSVTRLPTFFFDLVAGEHCSDAFCMLRDRMCRIPSGGDNVHLFCAVRAQSFIEGQQQTLQREPVKVSSACLVTACVDWIKHYRPATFVLENAASTPHTLSSRGAGRRRSSCSARMSAAAGTLRLVASCGILCA